MIEDLVRFVMFSKNLIAGCDLAPPKPLRLGHQNLTVLWGSFIFPKFLDLMRFMIKTSFLYTGCAHKSKKRTKKVEEKPSRLRDWVFLDEVQKNICWGPFVGRLRIAKRQAASGPRLKRSEASKQASKPASSKLPVPQCRPAECAQ